ncbi:hypothetical protein UFOVP93_44 [uncultured Caudovirales phage]|uniref:Uncharacterized protein n=1 Tax=uncultured Caudovirales phage TaxID=2100421 RepID=A0A6J5L313_9CAUD|nr:hypothetical protein UFOVP93_44 [uncultured Caudovirales phage]
MITPYISQQPVDDFGLIFPSLKYSVSLAETTDTTLTIPGAAPKYKALMKTSYNGVVWVALNATAAVPAGDTLAAVSSELLDSNPLCREVKAGDVLHFYTETANTIVSVVLYAIGTNN